MKKKIIITTIVLTIFAVGFLVFDQIQHDKRVYLAEKNMDIASVDLIKSSLKLYYVYRREYPRDIKELTTYLTKTENNPKTEEGLQKAFDDLKSFSYSLRGDTQSYKFTYLDVDGKTQIVEGNYQLDYHASQ